jgi:pyruvate dehydrogenase E2 component (dihydrolipoamide acetyltransferase)
MAETISMPKLGFDMAEGTLVRWVKNEGEAINKGDVLAEIETDKATVEVESSASGVVLKHLVDQGAVVPVSTPIAVVGAEGEGRAQASETTAKAEPSAEAWPNPRNKNQPRRKPAQPAKPEPATTVGTMPVKQVKLPPPTGASSLSLGASRCGKKCDLGAIQGRTRRTHRPPRHRRSDEERRPATPAAEKTCRKSAWISALPAFQAEPREDEIVQLTKLRQAIARRMTESTTSVPHFFVTHEYKMNALLDMRKQINEYLPDNEKLSVNDFILA